MALPNVCLRPNRLKLGHLPKRGTVLRLEPRFRRRPHDKGTRHFNRRRSNRSNLLVSHQRQTAGSYVPVVDTKSPRSTQRWIETFHSNEPVISRGYNVSPTDLSHQDLCKIASQSNNKNLLSPKRAENRTEIHWDKIGTSLINMETAIGLWRRADHWTVYVYWAGPGLSQGPTGRAVPDCFEPAEAGYLARKEKGSRDNCQG
jgi:hypothetical protein